MKVESIKIASLAADPKNARKHDRRNLDTIKASLVRFGQQKPIVIDGAGQVVAGNGTLAVAAELGWDKIEAVRTALIGREAIAFAVADNRTAELAEWDEDILAETLAVLQNDDDIDETATGFSLDEIAELIGGGEIGLTDPNDAPGVQDDVVTVKGDTWLLGNHRLRCGDSTNEGDVALLLNGVVPNLMVTDPPYGVSYDPEWRKRAGLQDEGAYGKVQNDDRSDWRDAWALFPGDVAYVWHGALHNVSVAESLASAKFTVRSQIVWVKTRAPISRGHYHWQHEPAFYAERSDDNAVEGFEVDHASAAYVVRAGKTAGWRGGRKQTTVWFIEHLKSDTGHGTQKPVECMRRPIVNNSNIGQAVYDPFCGSGTTIIAGEMEGRHVYAMELDEQYCDVIIRRWQAFIGGEATLEGDGRTFDTIKTDRAPKA